MRFHVIVPVFNGPDLLHRCVQSILAQEDEHFTVTIADDASDDPEVQNVCLRAAAEGATSLLRNENIGATRNIVEAIRATEMAPDDVILLVDGDDRLAHPGAIAKLREHYTGDVELTYGSYVPDPFDPGCYPARPIPTEVLENGTIRAFHRMCGQWFNHPLSFRRRAFDQVPEREYHWHEDENEPWLHYGYDVTLMLPLLEKVGRRAKWVPDFLYLYTSDRPEAVWRSHGEETSAESEEMTIRGWRSSPYDL